MDHVVVAGAGISGLAACLVLSHVAARVTLVERLEWPAEVGAALALQANGMVVLDRLGLLGTVQASGARIERMDMRNVSSRRLLTATVPDLGGGLDHALAVRRTDLHTILLAAVAGRHCVRTRFGCTVVGADPTGTVTIRCSSGGLEALRADLVVGADGVSSAVRETGGFNSRVSAGHSYARTVVQGDVTPWLEEYWTRLGSFGHAPLGQGLAYFWVAAQAPPAADAVARRDLPTLIDVWNRTLPAAAGLLTKVSSFDDLLINTVRRVDCRRWFSGRLVLIGDAAHAMAPNLGQGANGALVDTVILAEQLVTGVTAEEAVQRYDRIRRPAVRRVQDMAGVLQSLCGLDSPLAQHVRDAVLTAGTMVPQLGQNAIRRALLPDVRAVRSATVFDQTSC
jgi:2-polyprenyl-6-methoxyphenol hydroxylase-like FAD-dependent oxidoreductase